MIAFLLIALFVTAASVALLSIADSAIRGRNAWRAIRREMARLPAGVVAPSNVVVLRPAPIASQVLATPRPAPRLPHAAAA